MRAYQNFRKCVMFLLGFGLMLLAVYGAQCFVTPNEPPVTINTVEIIGADEMDNPPRLIGIGCAGGKAGPLWADEEDDFPGPCKDIHEIPLYQGD